ncbi:MAG: hypothetical protein EOR99_05510 [Mesorhizobium sp.]|nr:MAG: hypothetical protein EOR99_05510 [Mesorhizobium sp.]
MKKASKPAKKTEKKKAADATGPNSPKPRAEGKSVLKGAPAKPTNLALDNLIAKSTHGHLCVIIGPDGKTKLCKIDPLTGDCDLNNCIDAHKLDPEGKILAFATS